MTQVSPRKIFALSVVAVLVIGTLVLANQLFEHLDASEIMVMQAPISGHLTVYTQPGVYGRWFATTTKYPKRAQVWFSARPDQGNKVDESLPIRFNDNGKAKMSVGISWEMPLDREHVLLLHTKFGSAHAIEKQLVETVIQKSVYAAGPLMSSQESSASRRNDLFQFLEDQIQNGVYRTETIQEKQKDVMTGADKTVSIVKLVMGKDGNPVRADDSPLKQFGVHTFNPVINSIAYDPEVEAQIQQQQKAIMQVQLAIAKAKEAEQKAITVAKEGEANAASAKWNQEVVKATAVVKAQQELEVARLEAQAAEQTKRKNILLGEGEAERKRLVMNADGALEPKLNALVEIAKANAEAIKGYQGNWVPSVVFGSNGSAVPGSGAQMLVDMLTANAARQLGVDLGVVGKDKTGAHTAPAQPATPATAPTAAPRGAGRGADR